MVRKRKLLNIASWLAFALIFWSIGYANAYDSYVVKNLYKTRDALLDQRSHLLTKRDAVKSRMNELNKSLNIIDGYLRDTDKNIRDVEDAIKRVQ